MTVPMARDSRATRVIVETRPTVRPRSPGANRSAVRAWAGETLADADTAAIVPEVRRPGERPRERLRAREPLHDGRQRFEVADQVRADPEPLPQLAELGRQPVDRADEHVGRREVLVDV